MANLFERPIAATPMSTFVEMPLGVLDRVIERRQQRYDLAKAEIEAQEDSLLNLKYLPGDAKRHHELQAQWDQRLNEIVESADGDYSAVLPAIDVYTRQLKREIATGELGAQNRAYTQAMAFREAQQKRLSEGKSSQEGFNLALSSIGTHQTKVSDQGTFNQFQGYTPSNIVDPIKRIQDGVDEIVTKYNAEGMKYVDRKLIRQNIETLIGSNSALQKALQERIAGTGMTFDQYKNGLIESVITDKRRQEVPTYTDATGSARKATLPRTLFGVQQPKSITGDGLQYSGASVPWFREIAGMIGRNAWGEFTTGINKPENQKRIKYIENKTGEKFPLTPVEQAEWLERHMNQSYTSEVATRGATPAEQDMVTKEGYLKDPKAAVWDREGNPLERDEVRAIQGKHKDDVQGTRTARIDNVVSAGGMYPPGTYVMIGTDGEEYFVENTNSDIINSTEYNNGLIDMASQTVSGMRTVTLRSPVENIPPGTYQVEHVPTANNYHQYNLYQNGVLKYRKAMGKDKKIYTTEVNSQ